MPETGVLVSSHLKERYPFHHISETGTRLITSQRKVLISSQVWKKGV